MLTTTFGALSLFSTLALGATTPKSPVYPNCAKVTFTATASAINYAIPSNILDLLNGSIPIQNLNLTLSVPVTYTSKIVARYCEPEVRIKGREDQLEFLLHSITNNKNFWSGLGEPGRGFEGDSYSHIAYASKQGYPTLSLDRLGNGESDHPDPILIVQGPYEYALYHAIVGQIKSGQGSPLPRKYQDIIPIGNSYGSVIIANMVTLYPNDFTKVITTGYSYDALASFPGITAVAPAPAAIALPARFGTLPPGYLTTTSVDGRRGAFYGLEGSVLFPFAISTLDNNVRDVVSVGQFLSNYLQGSPTATAYKGRALVLTGEEDNAFCGYGTTAIQPPRKCGQRLPDTGPRVFPASDYSWYSVDKTGHSNSFHFSRFTTFEVAHKFIQGARFSRTGGA